MNYGELKHKLISLGFAEESDYEEFEDLGYTYDAINQAVDEISTLFPHKVSYELEVDNSEEGHIYVIMPEIDRGFIRFSDTPVFVAANEKVENGYKEVSYYKPFSDYEIETDDTLVIYAPSIHRDTQDSRLYWTFKIFYEKEPTHVDEETENKFIFDVPEKCHKLIPLLSAYYLWQDDEPTKAALYYNRFESLRNEIMSEDNKPRARVELPKEGVI